MGKKNDLKVDLKVVYVPLPPQMVEARRASLLLLLKWVLEEEEKEKCLHPAEGMKAYYKRRHDDSSHAVF